MSIMLYKMKDNPKSFDTVIVSEKDIEQYITKGYFRTRAEARTASLVESAEQEPRQEQPQVLEKIKRTYKKRS